MAEEFQDAGWTTDALRPIQGRVKVLFHTVQKKMEKASVDQQRPVFKEIVHITKIPADQFLRIDRPVRETDKEEFSTEWAHWCKTKENRILGMPVENWPALSDTQKAEFKAMGVMTVEQLADMPDIQGQRITGFNDLRRKAKVYMEAGKSDEFIGQIRAEAAAREAKLQAQLDDMKAMLEKLTAPDTHKKLEKVTA